MSTVENVPNDTNVSQSSLNNGKRSFIITVDDNGKIEVQPSGQREQVTSPKKMHNGSCKSSKKGKQRIRIALLEENSGSSDTDMEDSEETNDMISIDARSLETMHDRFVKIYNKKLRGKPSFVVLEDALIRKRIEETLQTPSNHSHAEQQTTPADMSAHMGSQTDEFLLECALRATTLNKGRSRGCQATDVSCTLPKCAFCQCAANENNINVPSLRRLSEMCAVQMANKLKQTPAVATSAATLNERAQAGTTPHVTISFLPVAAQKASTISAQQPSLKQQQFLPATNCAHSCANLQPTGNCCKCCHCCQQQQQQQQFQAYVQQQHPGPAATYCHCYNSCCLLKPTMAQTMLGFGHAPVIPSHCSHHMLPTPDSFAPQQTLPLPVRGCSSPCLCYRTPTVSMTTCNIPHCLHRQMQPHSCIALCNDCQQQQLSHQQEQQQLQQQQQQQQKLLQHQNVCSCDRSCVDAKLSNVIAIKSSKRQLQREDSKNPVNNKPEEPKAIIQQDIQGDIKADIQADILADAHQDVHEDMQDDDAQESAGRELHCNVSQTTVRHMKTCSYKRKSEQKSDNSQQKEHHSRNKMGSSCPAGKLFMARFGRTCLILKPTSSTAPPRLLTSRICRYTWSNKLEKN